MTFNKESTILFGFIALKFILQYMLIHPVYELHRDEFLHLDQANHLAWGYLSVPPVTSWTSYLIQLLGNSVFWIKFFPALYGALTILVVWKAIKALDGNLFALVLGATCVLFSALLRMNTLYQPNSLDVLSWTSVYFLLLMYIRTEHIKWLYFGAAMFAIGFLNKYNIAFLLIGLLPALMLSEQRNIFRNAHFYGALFVGMLLILPNLIWQYQNGFPVFHHLKELSDTQLVNVSRVDFLTSQLMFFMGSLIVLSASFYALLFHRPFKPYRLFLLSFCFTILAFLYFRAKDYYAIGVYPIYIAFGSVYLAHLLQDGWKRVLKPVAIAIPILFFIPMMDVAFPNKRPETIIQNSEMYKQLGMLRWEDGKDHHLPQDYADMLGWKELATKIDSIYLSFPADEHTLILCDNYGQAGAINYYSKLGLRADSFSADYVHWFDLSNRYDNLIRVKSKRGVDTELEDTSPYFEQSTVAASITNPFAREFGTTMFVFSGAKIDIRERIEEEIRRETNYD